MDKKEPIRTRINRMNTGEEVRFPNGNARSISATCSQIASVIPGREYRTIAVLDEVIVWRVS